MTEMLLGAVDNGRRGTLVSTIYTGDVGVRDRGDGQIELAWFGRQPSFRAAITGTLDGNPVTITGMRARELTAASAGTGTKAIVVTAERTG